MSELPHDSRLPQETQATLKAQRDNISETGGTEDNMGDVTAELENVKAARAGSGQATMTELGSGGFFGAFDSPQISQLVA